MTIIAAIVFIFTALCFRTWISYDAPTPAARDANNKVALIVLPPLMFLTIFLWWLAWRG